MRYISTRGEMPAQGFLSILLGGLAPDGGLVMPESYPCFSKQKLEELSKLDYRGLAFEIISQFADDIPSNKLREIINVSYSEKVFCNSRNPEKSAEITPVVKLDDTLFIQELSNGPTLAFKDLAMQFLGNVFEYALIEKNEKNKYFRSDIRRYRKRRGTRDERQKRHKRFYAFSGWENESVSAGANVFHTGEKYPQYRG